MGPQFIHLQTYARQIAKKVESKPYKDRTAGTRWTIAQILAEANRHEDATPHILNPKNPDLVHGIPLTEIETLDEQGIETEKVRAKGSGKRFRKDSRVLLTQVASYPVPTEAVWIDPAEMQKYLNWERETIGFIDRYAGQFGGELVSVVRHTDEQYPHIHAYILPSSVHAYRADALHPGKRAKAAAIDAGADP